MLLRSHGAKRPRIFDKKTPDEKTTEKTLVNGASHCYYTGYPGQAGGGRWKIIKMRSQNPVLVCRIMFYDELLGMNPMKYPRGYCIKI